MADPTPPGPGDYRWMVLLASFLTMFTTGSISYAAGVIHIGLVETFGEDSTFHLVWIGSLYFSMYGPSGPLASVIVNFWSCRACVFVSGVLGIIGYSSNFLFSDIRLLAVTYAVLGGTSVGLACAGGLVVLGYHFHDNISLASAISLCGQALGMFVHPPLFQYLIQTYGTKGALLIIGAISANGCVFAIMMPPNQLEISMHKKASSGRTKQDFFFRSLCGGFLQYLKLFTNIAFLFLFVAYTGFGMSVGTEFLYMPDFFRNGRVSKQDASLAVAFSGIGSCMSRLATAIVVRDHKVGTGLMLASINGIAGILTLLIKLFETSPGKVYAYGLLLGLYTGGSWALMSPMTIEILGVQSSASGIGLLIFATGFGILVGPPLSELIYNHTGIYYHVFVCAGVTFLMASVSAFVSTALRDTSLPPEEPVLPAKLKRQTSADLQDTGNGDLEIIVTAATE